MTGAEQPTQPAGAHPITVMWTTPRSRSTAFERMMIERGDHTVFDEPFSARYYFSSEPRSDRFAERVIDSDTNRDTNRGGNDGGGAVLDRLMQAARSRPVFVKEMAYHASGLLTPAFMSRFTNVFLVRRPDAALASFARQWPDLTEEEAGYGRLAEAFRIAAQPGRRAPVVVEADDLADDPPALVEAFCGAVGIGFLESALTWRPGMQPEWERWRDFYDGVAASSGFLPRHSDAAPQLDARLSAIALRAQPVYDELAAVRLRPVRSAG